MLPQSGYALVDGLRLFYQTIGSGSPEIILSAGSFNSVDVHWEDPSIALFLRRLAAFSRVVRFDSIGLGGSDRATGATSEPIFQAQLNAVLDRCENESVALVAMLDAGPNAIEYVVKNPDRISHLVLYNTTSRLIRDDTYQVGLDPDATVALLGIVTEEWGTTALATTSVPSKMGEAHFVEWYSKYLRAVGTPTEIQGRFRKALQMDVRELLPRVEVPTMVIHRRDYAFIPFTHGEYLASNIRGAELVELPGADGPMFWETPDLILESLERFVTGSASKPVDKTELLTLLITDIVESTELLSSMGDRDGKVLFDQHDEISRKWADAWGGHVVKTTGDGVLAAFATPSVALMAATAIRDELGRIGISIRAGVHVGEVTRTSDDLSGVAVNTAARIMALATADEILTSRTVRDVMAGSSFGFTDRGSHQLKGLSEPWQLFSVDAKAPTRPVL